MLCVSCKTCVLHRMRYARYYCVGYLPRVVLSVMLQSLQLPGIRDLPENLSEYHIALV